jgi:UDP-glucose 4-epimerase
MDVLITGAGGRIGSQLARILVAEGHTVRPFGLPDDPGLKTISEELGVAAHFGDLTQPESLVGAVSGVDAVCHLAAALTTHDVADDRFVDVNLLGTYNLLVAAREHAPSISRFVYTSSDAVYWPGLTRRPLYLPIDESHPLAAGSVYGASKIGAEAMCRAFALSYGIPYVVMRPTATASPSELIDPDSPFGRRWFLGSAIRWLESHDRNAADEELLIKLRRLDVGEPRLILLTDPTGVASLTMLTDARDVARAMRAMIDRPEAVGEAFNVGPMAPHSDRELITALSEALDLEAVEVAHAAVRPSWYVSSAKARGLLGYVAEHSVFDMVAEAVAVKRH